MAKQDYLVNDEIIHYAHNAMISYYLSVYILY